MCKRNFSLCQLHSRHFYNMPFCTVSWLTSRQILQRHEMRYWAGMRVWGSSVGLSDLSYFTGDPVFQPVAPPGFCNRGGGVRHGSIGGLEYEVAQSRLYCLCINLALCSTALQCTVYLSCVMKKFHDNESTHILHNFWTSTHRGGSFPLPPLAAPLISDPCSRLPGGSRREEQISRTLLVRLPRHSDDTVTRENFV